MGESSDMVKLYFEEIPVQDDDESSGNLSNFQTYDEVPIDTIEVSGQSSRSVQLQGGGVLQDLQFEQVDGEGDQAKKNLRFKIPLQVHHWSNNSNDPSLARGGASLACMGQYVYLFGGASRTGAHYNDLWRSGVPFGDGKAMVRWENIGSLLLGEGPSARSGHSATVLESDEDDCMIVFGGLNAIEQNVFNDVHVLRRHGTELSWVRPQIYGTAPQPRTEHSAVPMGDSAIAVFGGSSPTAGPLRDLHILQICRDRESTQINAIWSTPRCSGAPPLARELHSCCLFQAKGRELPTESILKHYGGDPVMMTEDDEQGALKDKQGGPSQFRDEGNKCFLQGDYEKAVKLYSEGLNSDPLKHLLYGNRSACYLKLNNPEAALEDALAALRLNPRWGKGFYREAMALVALDRLNEAKSAFEFAIELSCSDRERQNMVNAKLEFYSKLKPEPEGNDLKSHVEGDKSYLCIYGGRGTEGVFQDLVLLDLQTMTWLPPVDTPFPRCGHTCTTITSEDNPEQQRMFIFGGWNGGMDVFNSAMIWDLDSSMWTETFVERSKEKGVKPPEIPKRFSHAAAKVNNQIMVYGGVSFEQDLSDCILFDLLSEEPM